MLTLNVLECGRRGINAETLIIHGEDANDWPWHSVVYLLENGEWVASCGGTLVSEDVVLTAAHCIWKRSPPHMKFAFAKYYSAFDQIDDFVQIRSAEKIFTRPEYQDYRSNYGSDIGVVVLSEPVELSTYVKPACLDWKWSNAPVHLSENQLGTIVGMGLIENDQKATRLQVLEQPVVPPTVCIRNQSRDFKKYVAYTTFCAGWANGSSVCNGDSGGGIFFRDVSDPDRWILQGIVSVS
ncbi:Trypsin, partial [Oryctes borbonicus]